MREDRLRAVDPLREYLECQKKEKQRTGAKVFFTRKEFFGHEDSKDEGVLSLDIKALYTTNPRFQTIEKYECQSRFSIRVQMRAEVVVALQRQPSSS